MNKKRSKPNPDIRTITTFGRILCTNGRYSVGTKDAGGYPRFQHNKRRFFLPRLVAFAFLPRLANLRDLTIDHLDNNPGNTHVTNLEWCTMAEQIRRKNERAALAGVVQTKSWRSRPLWARRVGDPEWTHYASTSAFCRETGVVASGVNIALSREENYWTNGEYEAKRSEEETAADLPGEEWKQWISETHGPSSVLLSNLGRIRTKDGYVTRGKKLGKYLYFIIDGVQMSVHYMICTTFNGPRPDERYEPDHIDKDTIENRADNLRWLTGTEQKLEAQRLRDELGETLEKSSAISVSVAAVGTDEWTFYRSLTDAYTTTGVAAAQIRRAINTGKPVRGYRFRYGDPTQYELHEGEVAVEVDMAEFRRYCCNGAGDRYAANTDSVSAYPLPKFYPDQKVLLNTGWVDPLPLAHRRANIEDYIHYALAHGEWPPFPVPAFLDDQDYDDLAKHNSKEATVGAKSHADDLACMIDTDRKKAGHLKRKR